MPWLGGVHPAAAPWLCLPAASLWALNAESKEWAAWRLSLHYRSGFMSWHSGVCASGLPQRRDNSKTSLLAHLPSAQGSSFSCSRSVGSQGLSQSESVWPTLLSQRWPLIVFHRWTQLRHHFYALFIAIYNLFIDPFSILASSIAKMPTFNLQVMQFIF